MCYDSYSDTGNAFCPDLLRKLYQYNPLGNLVQQKKWKKIVVKVREASLWLMKEQNLPKVTRMRVPRSPEYGTSSNRNKYLIQNCQFLWLLQNMSCKLVFPLLFLWFSESKTNSKTDASGNIWLWCKQHDSDKLRKEQVNIQTYSTDNYNKHQTRGPLALER